MVDAKPQGVPTPAADHCHETTDVRFISVLRPAIGLVVIAAVLQMGVWVLMRLFNEFPPTSNATAFASLPRVPAEPRLQVAPEQELNRYQAAERSISDTYGWADRAAGKVRVPIDRAKELVLQEAGR